MNRPPEGYRIIRLDAVDSTNNVAKLAAADSAVDGTVFWTSQQTAGRGTHGREWSTPPGNLAVSILKRPRMPIRFAAQGALVSAVALADALTETGLSGDRIGLKWPNDVMVDGRKISGILLEGAANDAAVDWLVIGVGVNVVHHPAEARHPATDLAASGVQATVEGVLGSFLGAFERWWGRWRRYGFPVIATAWSARSQHRPGDLLTVSQGGQTFQAIYKGLSADGALVVAGMDGMDKEVASGEIFAHA